MADLKPLTDSERFAYALKNGLPKDTPHTCWYCGTVFYSYAKLRVTPQIPLPEKTVLIERCWTCDDWRCKQYEEARLDRAFSEVHSRQNFAIEGEE
jgi:hypothetical protein